MYFDRYFGSHAMLCRHFVLFFFSKCHVIKISKIFGDFVSLCQGLLPTSRHFENRRGEGPGGEVVPAACVTTFNGIGQSNCSFYVREVLFQDKMAAELTTAFKMTEKRCPV